MEKQILSSILQVLLETIITVVLPVVLVRLVNWINAQINSHEVADRQGDELALVETLNLMKEAGLR